MRIVVTGALGHIGSLLVHRAPVVLPGAELLLVDNLSAQRYCSLFRLPSGVPYGFCEADILDADLEELVSGATAVVHLAAITDAASSFDRAEEVERVNYVGTERVARACASAGVPLFFPSSTSVYGSQSERVDEACPEEELRPQSPYAEAKLRSERLLRALGQEEGLRYVVARFGTVFGPSPGMRFHTAVNRFIWQACTGQPITVWRTALDQRRPYLAVEDAVHAIAFAVRQGLFPNLIYNVVTVNATVRKVVDLIRERIPALQVQLTDARIMNQLSYEVAADRIAAAGFRPTGNLRDGIHRTIDLLEPLVREPACAA